MRDVLARNPTSATNTQEFREGENGMRYFYVRWGDDVQPYIRQLASEHIETLRRYCKRTIEHLIRMRLARGVVVIAVTARVRRRMINAKAFHCFKMFGFEFELREGAQKGRKQEYVLNFTATPDFEPEDMPPRLRRIEGQAISALPVRKRRPQAAAPTRAKTLKPAKEKKRKTERVSLYRLTQVQLWKPDFSATLASRLAAKLYKMHDLYHRLSDQMSVMWRRRPQLRLPFQRVNLLRPLLDFRDYAPIRARLEPRLIGESLRFLLFSFVSPEPTIDWSAYPFGKLPDEGERIAV